MALLGNDSTVFDRVIDVLTGVALVSWLGVVYLDWKYWSAS